MKILITGAKGFAGKNLVQALKNIKAGKDRTHPDLLIEQIYEYDIDTDPALLQSYCKMPTLFSTSQVSTDPRTQASLCRAISALHPHFWTRSKTRVIPAP